MNPESHVVEGDHLSGCRPRLAPQAMMAVGAMATVLLTWSATAGTSSDGAAGLLLVVNKADRTLGIHHPDTGERVAAVYLDAVTGHEVAASPDGRLAFVPIFGDSGVGAPGTDGQLIWNNRI